MQTFTGQFYVKEKNVCLRESNFISCVTSRERKDIYKHPWQQNYLNAIAAKEVLRQEEVNQTSKIMYVNTPSKRSSKLIRTGMGGTKWKSEDILKKQTGFRSKLAIHIGYYFFICGNTGLLLTAKLRFALKNDCKSLQQWRVCFH